MMNSIFIKYVSGRYFIISWLVWGGLHFYHGGFDKNITLKDITTHNVEYLRTIGGGSGRWGGSILDKYREKETSYIIIVRSTYSFYKMPKVEKENLTIDIIPPKGYTKGHRVTKLSSQNKTYYEENISEINQRNAFSLIDFLLLLFIHLIFFLRFYGEDYKRNKHIYTKEF